MRHRPVRFLALICLGVVGSAVAPSGSYAQEDLVPCADRQDALCGTLTVFEDRDARRGRTIDLNVMVLPSRSENSREPVFSLAGGPGGAATELISLILGGAVDDLLEERDVVLVDQRGTGGSHPLHCPPPAEPQDYFGHVLDPEWVAACRSELSTKADLALYTTSIAMDDVDEVREWLGYEKIVILSVSYGTRAAMEYMRHHGEHVAAAILDGIAAFSTFDPLYYAYDAQEALERVFAGCADDERCARSYPRLRHRLRTVLDGFREGAQQVEIQPNDGAAPTMIAYSFGDFGYTVRGMLYDDEQTSRLPRLLTEAAEQGELGPFAQAYYDRAAWAASSGGLAFGLYLSVVCTEDVPFISPTRRGAGAPAAFWGITWSKTTRPPARRGPEGNFRRATMIR